MVSDSPLPWSRPQSPVFEAESPPSPDSQPPSFGTARTCPRPRRPGLRTAPPPRPLGPPTHGSKPIIPPQSESSICAAPAAPRRGPPSASNRARAPPGAARQRQHHCPRRCPVTAQPGRTRRAPTPTLRRRPVSATPVLNLQPSRSGRPRLPTHLPYSNSRGRAAAPLSPHTQTHPASLPCSAWSRPVPARPAAVASPLKSPARPGRINPCAQTSSAQPWHVAAHRVAGVASHLRSPGSCGALPFLTRHDPPQSRPAPWAPPAPDATARPALCLAAPPRRPAAGHGAPPATLNGRPHCTGETSTLAREPHQHTGGQPAADCPCAPPRI